MNKKVFYIILTLVSMLFIDKVKALTLTDGTVLPDSPYTDYTILKKSDNNYYLFQISSFGYYTSSNSSITNGYDGIHSTYGNFCAQKGDSWNCYASTSAVSGTFLATSVDIYSDKNKSSISFNAGYGLKVNPYVNVTFHYMDYYNDTFDYGIETLNDIPLNTDLSCIGFKSFPKDFVNIIGYTYTNDKSNVDTNYSSYKVDDTHSDVYIWFIPRFDCNLYQSFANDRNTGQPIVYNKLTFTNYFNTLNYSDFHGTITDLSSNSSFNFTLIDDYYEFNAFHNGSYKVELFDLNNSKVYSDTIVVNNSLLVDLSEYDSYYFTEGKQYAFISNVPISGNVLFYTSKIDDETFGTAGGWVLGSYDLSSHSADNSFSFDSVVNDKLISYTYDLTNHTNHILLLQRDITNNSNIFYVPKGAYVSFSSDFWDENKNYDVSFDYKDSSTGEINSDTSTKVVISDDDKKSNAFFDNLTEYFKKFSSDIKNVLTTFSHLFNVLPVEIQDIIVAILLILVLVFCIIQFI